MKIIKSSPINYGPLDHWPVFLVMDCNHCIDILITPIICNVNSSLFEDVFPQEFKQAIITPLPKKRKLYKEQQSLLKVKSDIHFSLAKGKCKALVLFDRFAASDTTDHEILLHRLSTYVFSNQNKVLQEICCFRSTSQLLQMTYMGAVNLVEQSPRINGFSCQQQGFKFNPKLNVFRGGVILEQREDLLTTRHSVFWLRCNRFNSFLVNEANKALQ